MALVVVDGENVRRSRWPNLSPEELGRRLREWSARAGHEPLIVFDGTPPEEAADCGLRARVGNAPARIVGGGTFVGMI